MAEASPEDRAVNAFMESMPDEPQANPPQEAQVEGADAPVEAEEQQVEAVAETEEQDTQTIEIDPDEPLFEQELEEDGKKVAQKLSLKELQQGYLRERDYRKKTMDLARQREELPKLVAKQGQELSESYTKRLSELQGLVMKSVAAEFDGVDLNKLATEDPFEYVRISNRARQLNELLQVVRNEQEAEATKRKEEDQKATSEKLQKSLEILQKDIPNFSEPVVKRLIEASEEWGFSRDEVSLWTDHRLIKMLHALSSQQEQKKAIEAKRPEIEKKVAVVTKTLKPGKPQVRSALTEARAKFRKSGRPEDGIAIFESFV